MQQKQISTLRREVTLLNARVEELYQAELTTKENQQHIARILKELTK